MDEVLCDFMKGANHVVGGSFVQADKADRWNKISNTKNFWANLEWILDKRLYSFIMKYDAHILSGYSKRDANSRNGK